MKELNNPPNSFMFCCARQGMGVIEKNKDGFYMGEVPALEGCCAQGRSIEELMHNIRDVDEARFCSI